MRSGSMIRQIFLIVSSVLLCCLGACLMYLCFSTQPNTMPSGHPDHCMREQMQSYTITVVTCYFSLDLKAKHSKDEYMRWLENFLPKMNNAMIVFTDHFTESYVRKLRAGKPGIICSYDNVWALPRFSSFAHAYRTTQHDMDPERAIHTPELYMIWNSKMSMLNKAAKDNPYRSRFFFWVDSGSFRSPHNFSWWPDLVQVQSIFRGYDDRVLLGMIHNATDLHRPIVDICSSEEVIQAGFFGAQRDQMLWYTDTYFQTHDARFAAGCFTGKEQNIMTQIALLHQNYFLLLDATRGTCGDPWLSFVQALGSADHRTAGCSDALVTVWSH